MSFWNDPQKVRYKHLVVCGRRSACLVVVVVDVAWGVEWNHFKTAFQGGAKNVASFWMMGLNQVRTATFRSRVSVISSPLQNVSGIEVSWRNFGLTPPKNWKSLWKLLVGRWFFKNGRFSGDMLIFGGGKFPQGLLYVFSLLRSHGIQEYEVEWNQDPHVYWLVADGILILVYEIPLYNWVVLHPLDNPTNKGFFRGTCDYMLFFWGAERGLPSEEAGG